MNDFRDAPIRIGRPTLRSVGRRLAPPVELASFVVAHSEYSSPLLRRNLLSALVSRDAAEAQQSAAGPADGTSAP
mgnify:CR=1 FL=1